MEVNFCETCDNLLYTYVDDETDKLYLGCKCCGSKKIHNTNQCVYNNQINVDISSTIVDNKYLKDDVTIPVIENNPNIKCPNVECPSNVDDKPSLISYIKYDIKSMSYLYICKHCSHSWRNK